MAEIKVEAIVTGKVWKIEKQAGERVEAGEPIMILESMKMEIPVIADANGTLVEIAVKEGEPVTEGQLLAVLDV